MTDAGGAARRTALVTGASSGIGAGVVEVLSAAGFAVTALARRADRLAALAARTGCAVAVADVTDPAAMEAALAEFDGQAPDILVCNAGLGGGFAGTAATPEAEIETVIGVNVTATLRLLRRVLPGMIARGQGHVVTLGSVAALYPSPSALYGASKAAILQIGQNLRMELGGTALRVTDIRPGRVSSEFYDVAIADRAKSAAAKATGIRELSPQDVGEAVLFAVNAPAHVNVSAIELQPVEQTYGGIGLYPGAVGGG